MNGIAHHQRQNVIKIQGIPILEPIVNYWERVEHFQASRNDLLIATYPKSGTTWTQEIVDLILNDGDTDKCMRGPTNIRMPFLEMTAPDGSDDGITQLENMDPPRVIKTHLPIQLVPQSFWEAGCKVIYVARNPRDNVVSYYHFDRMNFFQPEPGTWQQYLEKFMKGQLFVTQCWSSLIGAIQETLLLQWRTKDPAITDPAINEDRSSPKRMSSSPHSPWKSNHSLSADLKAREKPLKMCYSVLSNAMFSEFKASMKKVNADTCRSAPASQCTSHKSLRPFYNIDPVREVIRIAEFLEKLLSKRTIDHIAQKTTFSAMRENPMANYSTVPMTMFDTTISQFMRKGEVGDWKNHFTAEQLDEFNKQFHKKMADCPIPFRFEI